MLSIIQCFDKHCSCHLHGEYVVRQILEALYRADGRWLTPKSQSFHINCLQSLQDSPCHIQHSQQQVFSAGSTVTIWSMPVYLASAWFMHQKSKAGTYWSKNILRGSVCLHVHTGHTVHIREKCYFRR
jgi:hypothetical protein